ncbi:hypothetical protein J4558_13410 [Leptolyngbya sp. 15MV]|nr:hypothetical protein J4558_13410 [Leptolyngbya sp. 15MV]
MVRQSVIPAISRIARTAWPATTPVPGLAGIRRTFDARKLPSTSCGSVRPIIGTLTIVRRAYFWAFSIAAGTSLDFPYP